MKAYFKNIYLAVATIAQGMAVTLSYLVRPAITLQYPEQKWQVPERSRGFLDVKLELCTACQVCALSCPVECIRIDVEKDPADKKKKYMARFDIDLSKCMFCSLCCDPCPTGAIYMSHGYEKAFTCREEMVSHFIPEGERVEAAKE